MVIINNLSRCRLKRRLLDLLKKVGQAVLNKHRAKNKLVSISFVDSEKIKKLNQRYRKKNKATDVLSFLMAENNLLGDIVICPKKIEENAARFKVVLAEEYVRLTVHGILHLLGYEHGAKKDRIKMFHIQEEIVSKFKRRADAA